MSARYSLLNESGIHDMPGSTYRLHILQGIWGAVTVSLLTEIFFWVFSLGQTVADFLRRILIFLPVPLIIGSMAGVLVWRINSSLAARFSFWTGATGMIFGYFAGVYIYDYLVERFSWGYRFFGIGIPALVGILFELFVVGCIWFGVKIYKKVHTRITRGS